ncbi:MAG: signal peptidase I [Clostridia bacterium]|nr:signal peptidase I [Clostridia bacterium]
MNTTLPEQNTPKRPSHRPVYEALDWMEVFLTALVCVVLLFTFVFRVVVVSGSSMSNTLQNGDYLVLSSLGGKPECGDIVVLQVNTYSEGKKPLIKRVIAKGGQWVDIDFATWTVSVGDTPETMEPIDEPYVLFHEDQWMAGYATEDQYPMQIEEGHLFVMGDNRNGSLDSRDPLIGQVDEHYVIGRAVFRLFPVQAFGPVA